MQSLAVMTHRYRPRDTPASAVQHCMWQHSQRHPDDPAYHVTLELVVSGPVELSRLRVCLGELTARHAALRTTFHWRDDALWQRALPEHFAPIQQEDVEFLLPAERVPAARRLAQALARVPFDLGRSPPLRALLVRLGDESYRFYLTLHHAICDARSQYNLAAELAILYDARTRDLVPVLPPLPVQYADLALQHADVPPLADGDVGSPARRQPICIHPTLADGVRAIAASERTTAGTVLLAAWRDLLRRRGHAELVVVATVASPRAGHGHAHVVGPMFDLVPLTRSPATDSFAAVIADTRAGLTRDIDPLEIDATAPTAGFAMIPAAPRLAGRFAVDLLAVGNGAARHDLQLVLHDDAAGGLTGFIEHRTASHRPDAAADLADRLTRALTALVEDPPRVARVA
jgi:hypothetical protein